VAVSLVVLGVGQPERAWAQHARPAFKVVPAAEAVRLYWSDAANQFRTVRAPTPHDSEPNGLYTTVRYDRLAVPQGGQFWDEFGMHPLVSEKRGRNELRGGQPQLDLGGGGPSARGQQQNSCSTS